MSEVEKTHIVQAAHFELGKVGRKDIRERVVYELFKQVDGEFARRVAEGVGIAPPPEPPTPNHGRSSAALSIEREPTRGIATRKVAALLAEGYDAGEFMTVKERLEAEGAIVEVIAKVLGTVSASDGSSIEADKSHVAAASVMYDAIYVPGGAHHAALREQGDALHFVNEAFKHHKPIAAGGAGGNEFLRASSIEGVRLSDGSGEVVADAGVVSGGSPQDLAGAFVEALAAHRHWDRELKDRVPA